MSASTLHHYEAVFPEPHTFIPERWLEGDGDVKRRYWVPFGRGSRACIGIHLAYVELYHVMAAVFRPNGCKSYPVSFRACISVAAGPGFLITAHSPALLYSLSLASETKTDVFIMTEVPFSSTTS